MPEIEGGKDAKYKGPQYFSCACVYLSNVSGMVCILAAVEGSLFNQVVVQGYNSIKAYAEQGKDSSGHP